MIQSLRSRRTLTAILVAASISGVLAAGVALSAQKRDENKKPSISLKATPVAGFTPLKVRLTVDVKGGSDDFQDFYCPAVEWVWGDDLESSNSSDCAPYEAGKSTIQRRYTAEHTYRQPGQYRASLRLKQKDKTVGVASVNIEARSGLQDGFDN